MAKTNLIWLTRPRADSDSLASELSAHGIDSIVAPVMHIEPVAFTLPEQAPDALIITSRYAIAAIPPEWKNIQVYCVGDATAAAAKAAGCTRVNAGDSDVLGLLTIISRQIPAGSRLVYLSGEEVRLNISALSVTRHMEIDRRIAYRAVAQDVLPEDVANHLRNGEIAGVSCFSPHTAAIVCELMAEAGLADAAQKIDMFALSLAVAEDAGALSWRSIHACNSPTNEEMVQLITSRFAT